MIDPITIITTVNTLVTISTKLFVGINSLIGKYQGADALLQGVSSQCAMANCASARLHTLLKDCPGCFASREGEVIDFSQSLEIALLGAVRIFSAYGGEYVDYEGKSEGFVQ